MDLGLAGKVALVGGASRGLGRATAERLAFEGARVVMSSRMAGTLGHAAGEIRAATGAQIRTVAADVTHPPDCERMVAETVEAFGGLDILVTNMGGPPYGSARERTDEEWEDAFDLVTLSVIRLARASPPPPSRSTSRPRSRATASGSTASSRAGSTPTGRSSSRGRRRKIAACR